MFLSLAQAVPDPEQLEAFAALVFEAVKHSNWKLVAVLGVIGLVWASRKFLGPKVPFLRSDRGGALMALAMGTFGAVANALLAGKAMNYQLFIDGLWMAIAAAGGFAVIKKLLFPKDEQIAKAEASGAAARAAVTSASKAINILKGGK